MPTERHEFQTEVKQLLQLMVHSLYSDKEVFLRELISNASDALDKLRFEQVTRPELATSGELQIRLEPSKDGDARRLVISDNGIGMTREEVVKNIGTIARSGTREYLEALKQAGAQGTQSTGEGAGEGVKPGVPPELIGQFGVGFYSAFMVADRVELVTRRAGQDTATRWESTGDGAYTLSDAERAEPGTTITLHLKPADPEHGLRDYTDVHVLRSIVRRYSDFVAYPIRCGDDTLNSQKAIWDRPKSEVTEDEYKQFYRHITHDWTDPLRTIPLKMEGTLEAYALLYVPAKAPFDLYSAEMKRGLQLYVKRVFVMDECRELLPTYLRFVRGVVDAHDLSLNVSREILQKDRQIQIIRKQLVKKVLASLDEMKREKPEDYTTFWTAFGPALKEGLLAPDADKDGSKDKLLDLVLARSTKTDTPMTSLADYVGRMKEGQDAIYVLTGPAETIAKSPLLEAFTAKGYEVLLFSDPIDELWLDGEPRYKDKPLRSIARGEITPGSEEERKQAEEAREQKQRELSDLLTCLRVHLQEQVKEVRLSSRLTSSPACLVADENDVSPRMQRILEQLGQAPPKAKPVLELNPQHAVVSRLEEIFKASNADPRLATYAQALLGLAHLADTGQVPDPAAFQSAVVDLLVR
jgi:molecular chaperone HtpG